MTTALSEILTSIEQHIETSRELGLHDTKNLLEIIRLDLQMKLHGVSAQELRALVDAVKSAAQSAATRPQDARPDAPRAERRDIARRETARPRSLVSH
jgi:hypothetical protein